MSQIILRAACEADADAMLQIYTPYVTSTRASWEYEPPRPAVFAQRVREHLDAGFPWLLAVETGISHSGGTVLGYAYAGRLGERRGYDWDAEATVYLCTAAHRRHIGTALYTALLALLRAQGYVNCYALITDPNPASEAFHRRMGFAEAARLPGAGYKQGQWIGLFYYHKLLCTPPAQPVPPVPLCALDGDRVAEILEDAARLCAGVSAPPCTGAENTPAFGTGHHLASAIELSANTGNALPQDRYAKPPKAMQPGTASEAGQ